MRAMLIVVSGTVASGKSTLSRALADEYERRGHRTAVIDLDLVYEMIGGVGAKKDDPATWQLARRASGVLAANFEREGIDVVIVDGEFLTAADRSEFTTATAGSNAPLYVTLRVSLEEALRRVASDPHRTFSRDQGFLAQHYASAPRETLRGDLVFEADAGTPGELARTVADLASP
jgi:tRNA uridine 5-carbamoylmethylation protein Kti12